MTRLENLQRELSGLEEDLFYLEMSDNWCYTNGNANRINYKIAKLREEIKLEKIALEK